MRNNMNIQHNFLYNNNNNKHTASMKSLAFGACIIHFKCSRNQGTTSNVWAVTVTRGVVVPERGGTPFRQIFVSRNGAPVNIAEYPER